MRERVQGVWRAAVVGTVLVLSTVVGAPGASAAPRQSFPDCPLLSEGMRDPCVATLINHLNLVDDTYARGVRYDLRASTFFGPAVRVAVLDFQGRNRLGSDGRVGAVTARALMKQVPRPATSRGPGPSCARSTTTTTTTIPCGGR